MPTTIKSPDKMPTNGWHFVRLAFCPHTENFNTQTKMLERMGGWLSQTRPIPRSPDGDKNARRRQYHQVGHPCHPCHLCHPIKCATPVIFSIKLRGGGVSSAIRRQRQCQIRVQFESRVIHAIFKVLENWFSMTKYLPIVVLWCSEGGFNKIITWSPAFGVFTDALNHLAVYIYLQ